MTTQRPKSSFQQIHTCSLSSPLSHFFGNLIIYFEFNDVTKPIDMWMRRRILTIFIVLILVAIICLLCLKPPTRVKHPDHDVRNPFEDVWKCCKITSTRNMVILCVTIVACGKFRSVTVFSRLAKVTLYSASVHRDAFNVFERAQR